MNMGGLAATLILSSLIFRLRSVRFRGVSATDRATRHGLGLVAVCLPIAGVALPFIPWRVMAVAIVVTTVGCLALILLLGGSRVDTEPLPRPDNPTPSGRSAS